MKWLLIFILIFCFINITSGQKNGNYLPGNIFVNIPSSQTNTSAGIAAYINSHFDTEGKKIAAIYSWLTMNIKYDADSIHYVILDEDNEERVSYALRRKRGVCENFAAVFADLCNQCGIKCFTVEGFAKQNGRVDRAAHVWCAALVNNKWSLYDPTWDATKVGSPKSNPAYHYFKISPDVFIQTHLPFDPMFQFLDYPLKYNDFVRGISPKENSKNYFNYEDSLHSFENMDRISKYISEALRITKAGWPEYKIETKLKRIRFQAEVLNQDNDADLYNSAVNDYNNAVTSLNIFLAYRNNQFQPAKPNEEIIKLFQKVSILISSANLKLKKIHNSKATLQLDTGDIQKKLDDLNRYLKQQEIFFKDKVGNEGR